MQPQADYQSDLGLTFRIGGLLMCSCIINPNDPASLLDWIAKPGVGRKLLAHFGSLGSLSSATLDDLRQSKLLTPPQAYRLLAAFALARLIPG